MSELNPEDIDFVRDYARRNADYAIVRPVVDFIDSHLAPPRIIRTVEELEALDPDSIVLDCTGHLMTNRDRLPAVVVATGEQVRAARKALEEDTE